MILRTLKRVEQYHNSGCFIACLATLKGISYEEAFKLIHPEKDYSQVARWDTVGLRVDESIKKLEQLGLKPVQRPLKQLRNLRRTALLIIQWTYAPHLAHGVIFDAVSRKFLDPGYSTPLPTKDYERQLYAVLYFQTSEFSHRVTEAKRVA